MDCPRSNTSTRHGGIERPAFLAPAITPRRLMGVSKKSPAEGGAALRAFILHTLSTVETRAYRAPNAQ